MKLPKPIVSPGLRGAAQEVMQSASFKRLVKLLARIERAEREQAQREES